MAADCFQLFISLGWALAYRLSKTAAQDLALYQSLLWNCPTGWQFIIFAFPSDGCPCSVLAIPFFHTRCPPVKSLPQLCMLNSLRNWFWKIQPAALATAVVQGGIHHGRGAKQKQKEHGQPLSVATPLSSHGRWEPSKQ